MAHSIEHSNNFHLTRRIAKVIAPDYRVFATENLLPGYAVLDLAHKTIEVAESTDEVPTIAAILFHIGHLRIRNIPELAEHFGKVSDIGEKRLISKLSKQGEQADKLAAAWAIEVLSGVFHVKYAQAERLILDRCWDEAEWKDYYLS